MSHEISSLEQRMYEALAATFIPSRAEKLKALYTTARAKLLDDVMPRTVVAEPDLTDHSAAHVLDVMNAANRLLAPDAFRGGDTLLTAADAYILCLSILFHDAGMVYGRDGHEQQIIRVYDWVRSSCDAPLQEKALIYRIAGAHTGTTDDGSKDRIGEVPTTMDLDGDEVKPRELAAILRFADELSEGPHRTSRFVASGSGFPPASQVYHEYAKVTNVHIARSLGRIVLTYRYDICDTNADPASPEFRRLLAFTFSRAIKVDRERRYTRFYSCQLAPFNRTEVTFNFWTPAGLAFSLDSLQLSDKDALDQPLPDLKTLDPRYDIDAIIETLTNDCGRSDHDV